jgi:hypothetical protein
MADADARNKLLSYLHQHVFAPVLSVDPESLPDAAQIAFALLQDRFRQERDEFQACRSAEEVLTKFERDWHSDEAVAARRGLAELGLPRFEGVAREFRALARELGVEQRAHEPRIPEFDPAIEKRIRARARVLWEQDGRPNGREDEYLERARELEAIADNPGAALLPNPHAKADEPPPFEEPVEPPEAIENQGDIPGALTDQGDRLPAPTRDAWKKLD